MTRYLTLPIVAAMWLAIDTTPAPAQIMDAFLRQFAPVQARDTTRTRRTRRHRAAPVLPVAPIDVPDIPAPAPIMEPEPSPKFDLARVTVDAFVPRFVDQQAWVDQEIPQWRRNMPRVIAQPPSGHSPWTVAFASFISFVVSAFVVSVVGLNADRIKSAWRDVAAAYAEWKLNRRDVMEMTT